ncbi:MAG: acyl-ACP thioesterase, partial [Limosilactobacillus sp.]|nr:acyl-ACP thioesterase [Limosilactobacillus sp.]
MAELTQNANSYEMTHTLTYYECTDNGHPSMSMLLSMMTMSSDVHSIFVGLDRDAIEQSGGAWVVIGYEG